MGKVLIILFALIVVSCTTYTPESTENITEREVLRSHRSYALDPWKEADDVFNKYYGNFIKDVNNAKYYPIWFKSLNMEMDGVIFKPEKQIKETVLFIHGYAGNIKGFRFIANNLLKQGYTVAALSLPGHGLADGDRGDIENFNHYGQVVNDFIDILKINNLNPEIAIGHSTGCTSLIIYNQNFGWEFNKIVFVAPLIKSYLWTPSKIVRIITKPFVKKINTKWSDPLGVNVFPLNWFDELIKWNKEFKDYNTKNDEILLLQGEKDDVVSWKSNIKSIQNIYINTKVVTYPLGGHTMFMKDDVIGQEILQQILGHIK